MQSLFMERAKVEQQIRNAKAQRERVAADNIDDPQLEALRKEIAALQARLSDIGAGEREAVRREQRKAEQEEREDREKKLELFEAEKTKMLHAFDRFGAALNEAGQAWSEYQNAARRAKTAVAQYARTQGQQDALIGMVLELPNSDVIGLLTRAGFDRYLANPHPGTDGNLSALIGSRLNSALVTARDVLFPRTPTPTKDES